MFKISHPGRAAAPSDDLKGRIVSFVRGASTEITPSEEGRLGELAPLLLPGAHVYVAHTPNAEFEHVIRTAVAAQRAGLNATPHIAVRRVRDVRMLRDGLAKLRDAGVDSILLIAGDAPRPRGEFAGTLDVLRSGILTDAGIARVGVAGHPEGHNAVATAQLWEALSAKYALCAGAAWSMHVVTQFGFDSGAFPRWELELRRRQISLPARYGIAGPAPIAKLMHFAMQCGIGISLRAARRHARAMMSAAKPATSPDQHLLNWCRAAMPSTVIGPHFFAFGGAVETAAWIRAIAAGAFEIDPAVDRLKLHCD